MRIFMLTAVAAAALIPYTVRAEDCKFQADRRGGEDVSGIEKIVVVAGAGELDVRGTPNAKRIEATGRACASSQPLLEKTALKVHRKGSTLYIEAELPDLKHTLTIGNVYANLDMKVTLPDNLPVQAQDSSGDSALANLKSLEMLDSSGSVTVRDIAGLVDLTDSSGDIRIDHVGSVKLRDSSGDVTALNIKNDIDVSVDSSGEMTFESVGGNVHIEQDSSGDIDVRNVKGNVTVENDTSGGIAVDNIDGDFTVVADTSGGVRVQNVRGKVSVP